MTYFKILPVLLLFVGKSSQANFLCGPNVDPCKCYTVDTNNEKISELVCNGVDLTNEKLQEIGKKISGDAYLLHLNNVGLLETILADTFKLATFRKIFIENNQKLTTIAPTAFATSSKTETLAVRNNPLFKTGVSDTVKLLADGLVDIEFQANAIVEIKANSFVNLPKAQFIRLDKQTGGITLEGNAFSNLPDLKQLSLNDNSFTSVGAKAIDLEKSNAKVAIFLQNNNKLDTLKTLIDPTNFILPSSGTVHLDLEKSNLVDFPVICYSIANKVGGLCYLGQNTITSCDCTQANYVKSDTTKGNVWGLPTALKCGVGDAAVAIKDCT